MSKSSRFEITPPEKLPPPWGALARLAALPPGREAAAAECFPVDEFGRLVVERPELVLRTRLWGLLHHQLEEAAATAPSFRERLPATIWWKSFSEEARRRGRAAAERLTRLLLRARELETLAPPGNEVRLLFVKGLPAVIHYYEKNRLRPTADVDVATAERHAAPLLETLDDAGCRTPYVCRARTPDEERAEGEIHYETRRHPRDGTAVEIHAGRYLPGAPWNWERILEAADFHTLPWRELGPRACRLTPEAEFVLSTLHAVSHRMKFSLLWLADAVRITAHTTPERLRQTVEFTGTYGLAAAAAAALDTCTPGGNVEMRQAAREWAARASAAERKLGRFFAEHFWSAVPGRTAPPYWGVLYAKKALRKTFFVPVRTAERVLGLSRTAPGFTRRRLLLLPKRWRKFAAHVGRRGNAPLAEKDGSAAAGRKLTKPTP